MLDLCCSPCSHDFCKAPLCKVANAFCPCDSAQGIESSDTAHSPTDGDASVSRNRVLARTIQTKVTSIAWSYLAGRHGLHTCENKVQQKYMMDHKASLIVSTRRSLMIFLFVRVYRLSDGDYTNHTYHVSCLLPYNNTTKLKQPCSQLRFQDSTHDHASISFLACFWLDCF